MSDAQSAGLTVAVGVLVAGAPMSVIYWMPYSESLFGAFTVWALVFMVRRRHLLAGLSVLGAGLTRLTAVTLVLVLCAAAVWQLWRYWRGGQDRPALRTVLSASVAPVVGVAGIGVYLGWANRTVSEIGGYFAAQQRGWDSGFDAGSASFRWLTEHLFGPASAGEDATGYAIASWSMVLVALLCVASLWPFVTRWIPWQVWAVAVLIAGMVLASDGIMHSRPRLLLLPVVLLAFPFLVRIIARISDGTDGTDGTDGAGSTWSAGRSVGVVALVVAGVAWCALGTWVSGEMLIDFSYAI